MAEDLIFVPYARHHIMSRVILFCFCVLLLYTAEGQNRSNEPAHGSLGNNAKYNDDKYSYFTTSYENADKERIGLDGSVYAPISIFSILIGIIYFILSRASFKKPGNLKKVILGLLVIAFVFIVLGVAALSLSFNNFFRGFEYRDFPSNRVLLNFEDSVERLNGEGYDYRDMREGLLHNYYVPLADEIREINDKRYYYLYKTRSFILCSFFTELIALLLFSLHSYSSFYKPLSNE